MPKRKKGEDGQSMKRPVHAPNSEPSSLPRPNSEPSSLPRQGARFHKTCPGTAKTKDKNPQLPSPATSDIQQLRAKSKRKRSPSDCSAIDADHRLDPIDRHDPEKPKPSPTIPEDIEPETLHPVAYWALYQCWPPGLIEKGFKMNSQPSTKRKSESSHRTERLARMEQHGIFMKASHHLQQASKDLYNTLSKGNQVPASYPVYPAEQVDEVLAIAENANEATIQRDVMPLVVPSAQNLRLCGEKGLESIGEELSAEWTRCATMGSTRPKPDYVAGLSSKAFSRAEFEALQNHATPARPFQFTPALSLPFLICEAKSGEEGLNKAHRQNLHSAGIAVRALIELAWAAYGRSDPRATDLYGQVLVFTISHNHDVVYIYGHFATLAEDNDDDRATNTSGPTLEFHRCFFNVFSLTALDYRYRYAPYNFVRNVYSQFAPQHLQRIKDAAQQLSAGLGPRTGASFAASNLSLTDGQSRPDTSEDLEVLSQQQQHTNDDDDTTVSQQFEKPASAASQGGQLTAAMARIEMLERLVKELRGKGTEVG